MLQLFMLQLMQVERAKQWGMVIIVLEGYWLECPRCGGRLRIVAAVTNPEGINRILEHLGLPPRAPPVAPARVGAQDW